jgi:hypothetical protein
MVLIIEKIIKKIFYHKQVDPKNKLIINGNLIIGTNYKIDELNITAFESK